MNNLNAANNVPNGIVYNALHIEDSMWLDYLFILVLICENKVLVWIRSARRYSK